MRDPHDRRPFLSEAQRALLSAVLDRILPAGAQLPGAGQLDIGNYVDGVAGLEVLTRRLLWDGLKAIEVAGSQAASGGFSALPNPDKDGALKRVESDAPGFFQMLVQLAYAGYYTDPQVLRAKGLSTSAPQPAGYKMPPFDDSLLEGVRRRGKAYRDA